ncbi:ImuA family protein [Roseivivax sp. CAU 1753]
MVETLLRRAPLKAPPAIALTGDIRLTEGRVHEVCGRARRSFALQLAGVTQGPVIWIGPPGGSGLNPDGMTAFCDPARLLFVAAPRPIDRLWALEETLRAGAVALAIADLSEPPGLTPVRRLQLAAEAGSTRQCRPTGLVLTPGSGGCAGVESRWQSEPCHGPGRTLWRTDRPRARMAPPKAWDLTWTRDCPTSSPARPGTAAPPDRTS